MWQHTACCSTQCVAVHSVLQYTACCSTQRVAVHSLLQYHNSYKNTLYPYLSFLVPQTSELLSQITHNVLAPLMLLAHLIQHVFTLIPMPIWVKSITHKCPPERLPLLVLQTAVIGTLNSHWPYLGSVSSPLCVWNQEKVCSQTQLNHRGVFNDYSH